MPNLRGCAFRARGAAARGLCATRIALAASLVLALVPGCDRRPPPGEPVPTAASGPTEAAGLRFLERVTGGAQPSDPLPLVIGIHGRGGSPEHFVHALSGFTARARIILPYAPDPYGPGFTWFPDWQDDAQLADGTRRAADRLAAMIRDLVAHRPTLGKPIVTGFSQGGMLSFTLAVLHPDLVAAAFPCSGFLAPPLYPSAWPADAPRPRIHAFHGTDDDTVPIALARATVKRLADVGLPVALSEYPGVRHAIPPSEQHDLIEAIEAALRASP
jgi:phospholipase/carboxylesterase